MVKIVSLTLKGLYTYLRVENDIFRSEYLEEYLRFVKGHFQYFLKTFLA